MTEQSPASLNPKAQLSFKQISLADFLQLAPLIDEFERASFPPALRMSVPELAHILESSPEALIILATLAEAGRGATAEQKANGRIIGYAAGCALSEGEARNWGVAGRAMYLANIVIAPDAQGRGYGSELLREFAECARRRDYELLAAQFRPGASYWNAQKLNARTLCTIENYRGSGESFAECVIDLQQFSDILKVATIRPKTSLSR